MIVFLSFVLYTSSNTLFSVDGDTLSFRLVHKVPLFSVEDGLQSVIVSLFCHVHK